MWLCTGNKSRKLFKNRKEWQSPSVGVVYLGGNHITISQFRRLRACQDEQEKFQIKRNDKLDVRAHVGRGVPRALETKKVCAAQMLEEWMPALLGWCSFVILEPVGDSVVFCLSALCYCCDIWRLRRGVGCGWNTARWALPSGKAAVDLAEWHETKTEFAFYFPEVKALIDDPQTRRDWDRTAFFPFVHLPLSQFVEHILTWAC